MDQHGDMTTMICMMGRREYGDLRDDEASAASSRGELELWLLYFSSPPALRCAVKAKLLFNTLVGPANSVAAIRQRRHAHCGRNCRAAIVKADDGDGMIHKLSSTGFAGTELDHVTA